MSTRRIGMAGIAIFATIGIGLAGCNSSAQTGNAATTPATPSPSPSLAAPKDALTAAIGQLSQSSYAFTVKQSV